MHNIMTIPRLKLGLLERSDGGIDDLKRISERGLCRIHLLALASSTLAGLSRVGATPQLSLFTSWQSPLGSTTSTCLHLRREGDGDGCSDPGLAFWE